MHILLSRSILVLALLPACALAQETGDADATTATDVAETVADSTAATPAAEETTEAANTTATTGTGSDSGNSVGLVGAPPEGKGQIVFFRPKKMTGAAIGFKVREGETELGKLRNGRYFVAAVEPGVHEYTVHSETKDVLTLEVEPGETYYVQGSLTMGILAGRPNLSPSDESVFAGMSKKLKPAK